MSENDQKVESQEDKPVDFDAAMKAALDEEANPPAQAPEEPKTQLEAESEEKPTPEAQPADEDEPKDNSERSKLGRKVSDLTRDNNMLRQEIGDIKRLIQDFVAKKPVEIEREEVDPYKPIVESEFDDRVMKAVEKREIERVKKNAAFVESFKKTAIDEILEYRDEKDGGYVYSDDEAAQILMIAHDLVKKKAPAIDDDPVVIGKALANKAAALFERTRSASPAKKSDTKFREEKPKSPLGGGSGTKVESSTTKVDLDPEYLEMARSFGYDINKAAEIAMRPSRHVRV